MRLWRRVAMKKTLVGGVGYSNLRDLSLGPILTAQLATMVWPAQVDVDADLSFGPIAIVQRFQAMPEPYERIVLFGAVSRGRPVARIATYRWRNTLPAGDEIQARIAEAVTGVVSLDNLLIVGEHFGIWPEELFVVEVEPADTGWGPGFSLEIAGVTGEVIRAVRQAALGKESGDWNLAIQSPISNPQTLAESMYERKP